MFLAYLCYKTASIFKLKIIITRQGLNITNDISESRTGMWGCKFSRHVCQCGIKNGNLTEPFFEIKFMLTTNDPVELEYLQKHFQNRNSC